MRANGQPLDSVIDLYVDEIVTHLRPQTSRISPTRDLTPIKFISYAFTNTNLTAARLSDSTLAVFC